MDAGGGRGSPVHGSDAHGHLRRLGGRAKRAMRGARARRFLQGRRRGTAAVTTTGMDKIWWNELWMGWPVDEHYAAQSHVTNAHRLEGDLLLNRRRTGSQRGSGVDDAGGARADRGGQGFRTACDAGCRSRCGGDGVRPTSPSGLLRAALAGCATARVCQLVTVNADARTRSISVC